MSPTFFSLVTLALAASSVVAGRVHPSRTVVSRDALNLFDPAPETLVKALDQITATVVSTNARRMAAGLNPMAPRAKSHKFAARDPTPSGTPPCHNGYLSAVDSNGNTLGYLATSLTSFGHYGLFTPDAASALKVAFTPAAGGFDITVPNSLLTDMPFFGATVGAANTDDNIGPGSFNYLYLNPTSQTLANSIPTIGPNAFSVASGVAEHIESSIWDFDETTNTVTPQWINVDASLPATHIMYLPSAQTLLLTGDMDSFRNVFGPVVEITLHFVPA